MKHLGVDLHAATLLGIRGSFAAASLKHRDDERERGPGQRRRTLAITVDRGGELILSAPPDVPDTESRDFALRKRMWVYKQLARKEALGDQTPRRVFTDGEGFAYLGRNYTLRLVPESDAAVKLIGGRFVMPKALARWPSAPNPVVLPACPALVGRQGAARATSPARALAAG